MELFEFQAFWSAAKTVNEDVSFEFAPKETRVLEFKNIVILTDSVPYVVTIHGRYLCRTREISYTFVAEGVGPIARYDIRGSRHRNAGRTHFQSMRTLSCPRQNLPHADARPDLEDFNAEQTWQVLLSEAGLTHTGNFFRPEDRC